MSRFALRTALLSAVLAFSGNSASAAVITFEGMVKPGTFSNYMPGTTLNPTPEFALTSSGGITAIADAAALAIEPRYASNGTAFYAMVSGATAQLTSISNSLFSVSSIDLVNLLYMGIPADDTITATLIGTFANGTSITQSFSFQNNNAATATDFASVALTGFVDLASFAIVASGVGAGAQQGLSVDNIVIGAAAVPEPGVLAIFGLGLAGIAAARRRKKSA